MAHYEQLVALLRSLPPQCELVWGDDCETVGGIHPDSVDVHAPVLSERLELNWPWTVCAPAASAGGDPTRIVLNCDAVVLTGRRPGRIAPVEQHVLNLDEPDLAANLQRLRTVINAQGLVVNQCGGWTTETITQSLRTWCAEHAGRADLRFRFERDTYSTFVDFLVESTRSEGEFDGPFDD